jgi:CYTH domain-containing protein
MSAPVGLWEVVLSGDYLPARKALASTLHSVFSDRGYRVIIMSANNQQTIPLTVHPNTQASNMLLTKRLLRMSRILRREWRRFYEELASIDPQPTIIFHLSTEIELLTRHHENQYEGLLLSADLSFREVRETYDLVLYLEDDPAQPALLSLWLGHPRLRAIKTTDESKGLDQSIRAVQGVVGMPGREIEKKFLLDAPPPPEVLQEARAIHISQTYLDSGSKRVEVRLRKRSQDNHHTYYRTTKRFIGPGEREEEEQIISFRDYQHELLQRDSRRETIEKTRYCFVYESQYLELDVFHHPTALVLLEVETDDIHKKVQLPSWAQKAKDVTDDPAYQNYQVAMLPRNPK